MAGSHSMCLQGLEGPTGLVGSSTRLPHSMVVTQVEAVSLGCLTLEVIIPMSKDHRAPLFPVGRSETVTRNILAAFLENTGALWVKEHTAPCQGYTAHRPWRGTPVARGSHLSLASKAFAPRHWPFPSLP